MRAPTDAPMKPSIAMSELHEDPDVLIGVWVAFVITAPIPAIDRRPGPLLALLMRWRRVPTTQNSGFRRLRPIAVRKSAISASRFVKIYWISGLLCHGSVPRPGRLKILSGSRYGPLTVDRAA